MKLTAKSQWRPWLLQFKFRRVVSFWVNKNLNDEEDDEAKMCRDKLREEGEKGTKNVVSFLGSVWLTGWSGWVPSSWRVIGDEFGFLSQSDSDVISAQRQWITHQSYEETLFNPLTQFVWTCCRMPSARNWPRDYQNEMQIRTPFYTPTN